MVECEVTGCSMPCTVCPTCQQCLCWQHLQRSSCENCRKMVYRHSFEHQLGRLVGIGMSVVLFGLLFLLLPRDTDGIIIQLGLVFLVAGFLLVWIGLMARM